MPEVARSRANCRYRSASRRCHAAFLAALISLGAAAPSAAQQWHDFRTARQANGIAELEIQLVYGAGRLSVAPSHQFLLYDATLRYDADRFEPLRDWSRDGDRGRLRLAISSVPGDGSHATVRLDDWDIEFDLENLPRDGDEMGEVELRIHPLVPTSLELGVGAALTRLDLGGLTLTSLRFGTGASDARLSFDTPNRTRMDLLSLKSGAAKFRAEGLGNARFERMEFHGVVGDVVLDFSGEWTRSAEVDIKMALGELVIRVPREIGVRIERRGFASLTAEDFEKVGDAYLSPNWTSAPVKLEIHLTAGIGTVEVERH